MSHEMGKAAQHHPMNLDIFLDEVIQARVDQIADPCNSLCDIDDGSCHTPPKCFCNSKYCYPWAVMIVYFFSTINVEGARYTTAVHAVDGMKLVKQGYCMLMLDVR